MDAAPYRAGDRRPIAVRHWRVFQSLAAYLARLGVSPNAISLAGMGFGILAGVALGLTACAAGVEERLLWLAAAVCVQLRLLANMLDGMVAIEGARAAPVGELFNEIPDRVSDAATLIGAGYAAGGDLVLGYSAACAALFTAYVRAMGKVAGANQEFCGPMAKQQRMFLVTGVALYCALAPLTWRPVWAPWPGRSVMAGALVLILAGCLVTVWRRLRRIAATLRK
ncbi:MAG TPA: CDP-alcohol phosphatidyltransferase family protein [Gemmataceae bacterium]|nr:CDP-alcohol phosphatidyltransferase family protein [Gemmataceae bacterium]